MSSFDQRIFLRFDQRNFSKPLPQPNYRFTIDSMTWSVENGGPEEAVITADGDLMQLMRLPQLLRVPVTVTDAYGGAMWWGLANEVEIHLGGLVYVVSLDGMANSVAVEYREEDPAGGDSGSDSWEVKTANLQDTDSQALYGVKRAVFNIGEARQADAEAARATYLAKLKLPQSKSLPGEKVEKPYGVLKLRGWFETLSWGRFSTTRGYVGNVEKENGGLNFIFGAATGVQNPICRFVATGSSLWKARFIWLKIYRVGSPADNVNCGISDYPYTGMLANQVVAGSSFNRDSADWYIFDMGAGCDLTPGVTYQIVISRSGSVDANNYYGLKIEEDVLLLPMIYYNGSTYPIRTPNSSFVTAIYGEEETTTQMKNVVASSGQFLEGCVIKNASGVSTRMFFNAKIDSLEVFRSLQEMGDSAGNKMDAWVNSERWLVVKSRPAATNPDLLVMATGEVKYRNGRPLIGSDIPVGRWARIESLLQAGGDYGAQSTVFLTRAEWRDGKVKVWWD